MNTVAVFQGGDIGPPGSGSVAPGYRRRRGFPAGHAGRGAPEGATWLNPQLKYYASTIGVRRDSQ